MPTPTATDRHELVRRDLASRGIDLDELVAGLRAEGCGWRIVAARISAAGEYVPPLAHSSVRRWYEPAARAAA